MNVNMFVQHPVRCCNGRSSGGVSGRGEGLNQEPEQGEFVRVAEFLETDGHVSMAPFGLGTIGAAQTIPPGEVEAEITVGFAGDDRMMDAVHVGGNQKQPQQAVKSGRQLDVAVTEHGAGVQHHFEGEYRLIGGAENDDGGHFNEQRKYYFQRVKTVAAGDIQVKVGVVHPVQPPEKGGVVKQEVLKIDHKIEDNEAEQCFEPERGG